eukprot:TRINITY_DN2223_c0_g5_i1.p1 TRINITY_DN2223_c0_g5~~TRINITY_DN2223_c0_g5_i1.p1  ORF type:complete len:711 (+),score=246.35 TRINITY_DN2223_c0_g5_i1:51-2183(+)
MGNMNHILFLLFASVASAANVQVSSSELAHAAARYAVDYSSGVSPVQKVVGLLKDMIAKGKQEAQDERVQFGTYSQWCEMTQSKKNGAIADANSKIDALNGDLAKANGDAGALADEIAGHQADIDASVAEQDNATAVNKKAEEDFNLALTDYVESIDALGRAIKVLNKQAYDRAQAEAEEKNAQEALVQASARLEKQKTGMLLQLSSESHAREVKQVVTAFLQNSQAPEVSGYEFQSNSVIKMLEDLEQKFYKEKVQLEKEEATRKHAHNSLMASLKTTEEDETNDRDKKTGYRQKKLAEIASMTDDLDTTTATKKDDEQYISEVKTTCEQKATDFEARQKLRVEEVEAIEKAIEILGTDAVSGNEEKHLGWKKDSFIQKKMKSVKKTALAALRSSIQKNQADVKEHLIQFLQSKAGALHSRTLSRLVAPVANTGAMTMIKEMLQDLVTKLQEEALADENKKQYCDTEIAANTQTRTQHTQLVDELTVDQDKLSASVQQMASDIENTQQELADLAAAVANATEIRSQEKAKNTETIADAKAAQDAVAKATSVLQTFYDKAGQATALVQQNAEQPAIFDSPYKGMGESGGALNMLESIASDFAQLEAETSSEETSAADAYEAFMKESKMSKTKKDKDVEHWTAKKQEQSSQLEGVAADLDAAQKELDASTQVWDKLKGECLNNDADYETEVARRNEEIQALKDALDMLENI